MPSSSKNPLSVTAQHWLHNHRRAVLASAFAVLVGTGATAFAVSDFVPRNPDIAVQQIQEAATPLNLADQAAQLDKFDFTLQRSDSIRPTDTADSLLKRLGVQDLAAAQFLRTDSLARTALLGKTGRVVRADVSKDQGLSKLTARWASDVPTEFNRLVIESFNGQFFSRMETDQFVAADRLASGTVYSSLFAATDEARIPDAVATQIAEIFSNDIDFHKSLRKGDRFSVVYESLEADGEPLKTGRVVAAEFINGGKQHSALWFHEPSAAKGEYYTLDGQSLRKAFLASPLEFSRVTSGFGMRVHPLAREWRAHNGVDYGAPIGTPIRTVGDGVVKFAGVQRGYGNVVEIEHRGGRNTLYAHMDRIGVKQGQRIAQGDVIGTVGRTGWATGPHLHFEFRVNGSHQDPMVIAKLNESTPISAAAMNQFRPFAERSRQNLLAAASVRATRTQ
jgi:murein DD-endopeptidase MepM/ murein hydrolase activator NlpD